MWLTVLACMSTVFLEIINKVINTELHTDLSLFPLVIESCEITDCVIHHLHFFSEETN